MSRRLLLVAMAVVAACGCRMCSDSCDYSPPVAGGRNTLVEGRAGSAQNATKLTEPTPQPPRPPHDVSPSTPLPGL